MQSPIWLSANSEILSLRILFCKWWDFFYSMSGMASLRRFRILLQSSNVQTLLGLVGLKGKIANVMVVVVDHFTAQGYKISVSKRKI